MDGSEQPSSLQSLCHVRACELFPKSPPETEDGELTVPFIPVCGENVEYIGRTTDGVLALSNYRLYLQLKDTNYNIPLGLIELLEVRDIFFLHIACKDARSLRCTFSSNEHCSEWYRRLHRSTSPPKTIENFFAFAYYAWAHEAGGEEVNSRLGGPLTSQSCAFRAEVERLQFDVHGAWRISQANADHALCPSYPRQLLVPACISDDTLEGAARFRSARRVPAVVWRHTGNGAVIARCSQPEVGWLGWRSAEDEDLIKAIADACAYDRGRRTMLDLVGTSTPTENGSACVPSDCDSTTSHEESSSTTETAGKKVLIMDARSYTTAVANRARGGGCECPEYYPSCDIQFMNLANIHSIRKSFHAVRNLCATAADQPNWYSLLEGTRWLQHMSGLMRAAVTVASAVAREGRPVLVHCSDGWDRTPQIVALAELLLDPHYRTVDGFQVLCEREWLDFGHKFADRCGHNVTVEDQNERCPVFLQWLDCVHQLLLQFPCYFQFSQSYLVKLAQHTYSNLFGTFLLNTSAERENASIQNRTFSVWKFLKAPNFRNHLYTRKDEPLWPSCNVRDLVLWSEVYLGTSESTATPPAGPEATSTSVPLSGGMMVGTDVTGQVDSGHSSGANSGVPTSPLPKTRSYGDLMVAADHHSQRRSSDPSVAVDLLKLEGLNDAVTADEVSAATATKTDCRQKQIIMRNICLGDEDSSDSTSDPGFIDAPRAAFDDDDDENEESTTESRSEATLCATAVPEPSQESARESVDAAKVAPPSEATVSAATLVAESSTDTLVAEAPAPTPCSSGSSTPPHPSTDVCRSCRAGVAPGGSGKTSRYSTPPPCSSLSRTPSSGYPATPVEECRPGQGAGVMGVAGSVAASGCGLDDLDGLAHVRNEVQTRLQQIVADHKAKEESLQRELHTTRLALMQQVCHQCNQTNIERPDDVGSLPESVCSGEQPSAGESLPSDVSWENLEERDAGPTLWVPDHAVNRCMGCDTEFWLGRRKHHCRNCGKIFCYDCSEYVIPLPNEQLYDPVRVCTGCFARLQDSAAAAPSSRTTLSQVSGLGRPHQGTPLVPDGSGAYSLRENCKQANATASDHVAKCSKSAVTAAST